MNLEETLKAMLEAAAGAAKGKWGKVKGFAQTELRTLAEKGRELSVSLATDLADAAALPTEDERAAATAIAKKRAAFGMRGIVLAGEGLALAVEADVKLAAQDAVNAALGVLRKAINDAAGIGIL